MTAALACIVCGLIGTVSILLTPRPAVSSAPSVDVSDLEPGGFKVARHPVEGPAGSEFAQVDILFVRRDDGKIAALHLPAQKSTSPCQRLAVDVARRVIECETDSGGVRHVNRWDLDGRGILPTWSKLGEVTGHEESGMFLLHP